MYLLLKSTHKCKLVAVINSSPIDNTSNCTSALYSRSMVFQRGTVLKSSKTACEYRSFEAKQGSATLDYLRIKQWSHLIKLPNLP
jgi:hypothetical protein